MASYPVTKSDTSLVADLRTQLFGVKGELERERNGRLSLAERVVELEAQLAQSRSVASPVTTQPVMPTFMPFQSPASPIPPAKSSEPPANRSDPTSRMRAWGFPQQPPQQSQPRNRDSFFGLSQALRRGSAEDEREEIGVDLPPFLLSPPPSELALAQQTSRAVSDPTRSSTPSLSTAKSSESTQRSTSLTSSASSALSFFSGYLPGRSVGKAESPSPVDVKTKRDTPQRLPSCPDKGVVDFTKGCKCCQGEIIEL